LGGKDGCKLPLTAFSSVKNHTKSRNVESQTAGIYNRENEREGKKTQNKQRKQKKKQEKNRINRV